MIMGTFGFSEAIALIAVVTAFYYGWQNSKLTKRLIAKEAGEAEARKRAELGVNLFKIGKSGYRLKVFNKGGAAARNVRIEVLDNDSHLLIQSDIDSKFPHECIEPQQGVELIASVHFGSKSKHPIKVIWDDDLRTDCEKIFYPTI